MDRKFEKFNGGPTQPTQERVYVSISKASVIIINQNCYRMLGKPSAVNLYFSHTDDTIAVEPVQSFRLPAAFPVKQTSNYGTWKINAAPFCQHFGIRIDTTERFISPEIRDGALQLKLTETVTVRNIKRRKKKE